VGLRSELDGYVEEKISCPHRGSKPGPSSPGQVAMPAPLSNTVVTQISTYPPNSNLRTTKNHGQVVISNRC